MMLVNHGQAAEMARFGGQKDTCFCLAGMAGQLGSTYTPGHYFAVFGGTDRSGLNCQLEKSSIAGSKCSSGCGCAVHKASASR